MELDEGLCVTDCERCPRLVDSRSRIVNGVGPADAEIVFVGEAPGADEDEGGEPFVGRSGTVLDDALRDAGLARADVRITNSVRCRPPENRDPHVDERENCRGYLAAELAAIDPEIVVALGKVPAENLLERSVAVTDEAGEVYDARLGETSHRVLVCVHPAATLYDRSQQDTFESTIQQAATLAGEGDGDGSGQARLGEW
ncbi:uracil-DNA glycosylase family protein [Halobaculum sp. MBLA0147]|uniref:uracil-DNA glycosylase n=1 Tax=Halobaculum sp. MBLA0147 TaxID=3079934 RepID=UPI0035243545